MINKMFAFSKKMIALGFMMTIGSIGLAFTALVIFIIYAMF
jgi:hypothetical protein